MDATILLGKLKKKADLIGGKVPQDQLPSYVDDVLEFSSLSDFPEQGEAGKIYVAMDTNRTYRWSGTTYVQIGGGSGTIPTAEEVTYNPTATHTSGSVAAALSDTNGQIVTLQQCGFTVVNGELNMTYEEA